MPRTHWHILKDKRTLTMARRLPVRFDLKVVTQLEGGDKLRLARQIRQDIWRALQNLRGFAPAVQITDAAEGGVVVTAGGQVDGTLPRAWAEACLLDVLSDPANRARWVRWAL